MISTIRPSHSKSAKMDPICRSSKNGPVLAPAARPSVASLHNRAAELSLLPFNSRLIILTPILLGAFYLRLHDLGNWPVRWDEAFSVWGAQMGLVEGTNFTAGDVHPPLHPWLLHVWVRLAGISEFAIRAMSVFPALITISLVYSLTLRLSRQDLAALFALLLITVSPYHIQWSQDGRMYALATMFASLAIYAYLQSGRNLFAFSAIGAVLSHYFGAIVIGTVVLYDVIVRREMRRRQWYIAFAIVVAVCLAWGMFTVGLMRKDPSSASFDPRAAFVIMANVFAVNSTTHAGAYTPHVFLIIAIFFLGVFLTWRDNPVQATFIVFGCVLPPIAISLLGLPFVPVHVNALQERYFSLFAPFAFAGFGIGLASMLKRRWLRAPGAIVCAGLLAFQGSLALERADRRYFKDDYRSMMAAVTALTTSDDIVFFASGGRKPVVYYHLDRAGYDVQKSGRAEPRNVIGIPRTADNVDAMMRQVFAGINRFWLIEIEAHLDEPLNARTNWIDRHYHRIYHIPVAWNGISLYSKDENDTVAEITAFIPPVVTEARPADQVRIGVPAGTKVDLVHSGQVVDTHVADTWMLHQFDIYAFYFNGVYELRVGDTRYPFLITHSQDYPG